MSRPRVFRAPGRVNLIGEHTDYNQGFVLPVALDLDCRVTAVPAASPRLAARSVDFGEERSWPLDRLDRRGDWGDYVAGVAVELIRLGVAVAGAHLQIRSTVPIGAGLSSSAALEVAVALALCGLAGAQLPPAELALACQRAENHFVGTRCGIMDQFVAVLGREDHALLIDCRSLEYERVPLPDGCRIAIVNTMVRRELGASEYNRRRAECEQAAALLGRSLRGAAPDQLDALPQPLRRRARHVITENERARSFVAACRAGDLERMGRLMYTSHASLRDDYEVSCPELDFLVDAARGLPGVIGARMTGAGFGGCTVNLVRPEHAHQFGPQIAGPCRARFGVQPEVYLCRPSAGASEVAA